MGDARQRDETPFDPEARWSVGAAADRAGVTHSELIDWVQRGRLEVETVQREGVEIRVVRAGDVAALAPHAARAGASARARRRAAPAPPPRPAAPARPAPSEPERPPPRPAASEPPAPPAQEECPPRPFTETQPAPSPAPRPAPSLEGPPAAHVEAIEALRDEVARLRSELDAAPRRAQLPRVPPVMRRALAGAAAVGAALGVAAGLLLGDIDGRSARAGGPGGGVSPRVESLGLADGPSEQPREVPVATEGPWQGPAVEVQPAEVPATGPAGSETPDPLPPSADASPGDAPGEGRARAGEAAGAEEPVRPESGSPDPGSTDPGSAAAPPPWERERIEPRWLSEVDGARTEAEEVCVFRSLLREGGEPALLTLGPCYGAPGAGADGGAAPGGTHRVAGAHVCAHHAFIERVARASRDPDVRAELEAEAEAALAQGLAPPLLRLRADRAAVSFLRDLVGAWAQCGLDGRPLRPRADDLPAHAWSAPRAVAAEGGGRAVAMTLRSWMRVQEGGPLRRFELDLVLGDGPRGDRMEALRWPDGDRSAAGER